MTTIVFHKKYSWFLEMMNTKCSVSFNFDTEVGFLGYQTCSFTIKENQCFCSSVQILLWTGLNLVWFLKQVFQQPAHSYIKILTVCVGENSKICRQSCEAAKSSGCTSVMLHDCFHYLTSCDMTAKYCWTVAFPKSTIDLTKCKPWLYK